MAKSDFGCRRPECGSSTNLNEDPSFGTGELDEYGFWEYPCYVCARAFEIHYPEYKCWPYKELESEDEDDNEEIFATAVTIALCDEYMKGTK